MTSDWVSAKMKDEAIDFARDNSHIKFCDVMYKLFWIKGDLSNKQYLKLLEIKAAFLRSRNRRP